MLEELEMDQMTNIHSTTRSDGPQDLHDASLPGPGMHETPLTEISYVTDAHEPEMKAERILGCKTETCPFGVFGKLPMEVRFNIWRHLMPELRKESEPPIEVYGLPMILSPPSGNRLAILRTSHALNYEVQTELYRSRTLCISIRPGQRGWRAEDLPGSTVADFQNTKFHRFKSIKMEVPCSRSDDPGQLLYARASILSFIRVLRGCQESIEHYEPCRLLSSDQRQLEPWINGNRNEGSVSYPRIPKLQVAFLNTEVDTWQDGSGVGDLPRGGLLHIEDNLELLIHPFGYLRNVEQINFSFPEGLTLSARLLTMVQFIKTACRAQCFDDNYCDDRYHDDADQFTQREAQRCFVLDIALDTTPGPTAAILQRERLIQSRSYMNFIRASRRQARIVTNFEPVGPKNEEAL
ncbi:hypothetical protein G7Y79_00007g020890 [Physcia stellaris]|nr:hypothetical protein G7Y79_00007g020890 [Physcia stellaris]